jgi:hypothetical protein
LSGESAAQQQNLFAEISAIHNNQIHSSNLVEPKVKSGKRKWESESEGGIEPLPSFLKLSLQFRVIWIISRSIRLGS